MNYDKSKTMNTTQNQTQKQTQTNEELQRELTLKAQAELIEYVMETYFNVDDAFPYYNRYKGMSWAEIDYLLEEEEEEAQKKIETDELRKTLSVRKELHNQGLYELEEGEELDL